MVSSMQGVKVVYTVTMFNVRVFVPLWPALVSPS